MASRHEVAAQYYGYLIQPDKNPSPVLEQLLLGIASYIVCYLPTFELEPHAEQAAEKACRTLGQQLPDST